MQYVKIWIHTIWSTLGRKPLLLESFQKELYHHIKEHALGKNVIIDMINGTQDHIHCLLMLGYDQNIATVMQLIKGESSYWINRRNLLKEKFSWQDEYFALSIGHSQVERVREYIKNQKKHHSKKSFEQEYDELIAKYGFEKLDINSSTD